jgi:peptidoglycan/xylan/chitin deacetylase (PgdA/CDA1 family)
MPDRLPGALVISLDFELHWGVRVHRRPDGPYRVNLLGAREAIPRMLNLFARYQAGATWATVGFLFAASRGELEAFSPTERPLYPARHHNPYAEPLGESEENDPLHFAASLIRRIGSHPRQEIASHTFSHYYCLDAGHTRSSFAADLRAAVAIAAAHGIPISSLVFPRNQVNPAFLDLLPGRGIECYRGRTPGWLNRPREHARDRRLPIRAARLADNYFPVSGTEGITWEEVVEPTGLCNVPSTHFLRPYSPLLRRMERLRFRRIARSLEAAAIQKRICHLWWHPHNFGTYMAENFEMLTALLEVFRRCRERYGMQALSMREASQAARQVVPSAGLQIVETRQSGDVR